MPVILARMVMPRSRSSSLESMTRSTCSSCWPKMPLWLSMASTSVVLPWSTWAMMAMLRMAELLLFMHHVYRDKARGSRRRMRSVLQSLSRAMRAKGHHFKPGHRAVDDLGAQQQLEMGNRTTGLQAKLLAELEHGVFGTNEAPARLRGNDVAPRYHQNVAG